MAAWQHGDRVHQMGTGSRQSPWLVVDSVLNPAAMHRVCFCRWLCRIIKMFQLTECTRTKQPTTSPATKRVSSVN